MSVNSKTGRLFGTAMGILAVAMAGVVAYEWIYGAGMRQRLIQSQRAVAAQQMPLRLSPPFALAPLAAYAVITARPLFIASRQPTAPEGASAPVSQNFELVGIAQDPAGAIVLLKDTKTGKTERVREGQAATGPVEVISVTADSAVIRQAGSDVKLDLEVARSAAPPMVAGASGAGTQEGASGNSGNAKSAGGLPKPKPGNAQEPAINGGGKLQTPKPGASNQQTVSGVNAIRAKLGLPLLPE